MILRINKLNIFLQVIHKVTNVCNLHSFNKDLEIMAKDLKLKDEYSLKHRVPAESLLHNFSVQVSEAKSEYLKKVGSARDMLEKNLIHSMRMDSMLGTCEEIIEIDNSDIHISSDGRPHHRCPIVPCNARDYKMKRHLKKHQLSPQQTHIAMECCKIFVKNCRAPSDEAIQPQVIDNSNFSAELINRKKNPKACILCEKLIVNMSDHITQHHQIDKSDPQYTHYIKDCEVVPLVLTKKVNGVTTKLTGSELDEAHNNFKIRIEEQKSKLLELKQVLPENVTVTDCVIKPRTSLCGTQKKN